MSSACLLQLPRWRREHSPDGGPRSRLVPPLPSQPLAPPAPGQWAAFRLILSRSPTTLCAPLYWAASTALASSWASHTQLCSPPFAAPSGSGGGDKDGGEVGQHLRVWPGGLNMTRSLGEKGPLLLLVMMMVRLCECCRHQAKCLARVW